MAQGVYQSPPKIWSCYTDGMGLFAGGGKGPIVDMLGESRKGGLPGRFTLEFSRITSQFHQDDWIFIHHAHPWTTAIHTIPAAFPREYPRATLSPDIPLRLSLKQYTPNNQPSFPGDVTLIVAHGNGFHKELYEPFLDDLLALAHTSTFPFRIRSVWALDAANQGASDIHEALLGEDTCWNDYSRDIEAMVTHFAPHMPSPRFSIGHSMGGQCIFECALRNPTLFTAIVGIDPVISKPGKEALDPPPKVYQFLRPDLSRPEPARTFSRLHLLTLPILYIFGSASYVSSEPARRAKLSQTPHAEEVAIPDARHTITQEKPRECAVGVAGFWGKWRGGGRRKEKERKRHRLLQRSFW
ncbi:Alpha/beta hydrolase family-domain-containing protein [Tirmania nivea]|nr:Alpha/beta hydrolase family-domain-containing protein [Tirmania nivea]